MSTSASAKKVDSTEVEQETKQQLCAREVAALAEKNGGSITAEQILKAASSKTSVLHCYFEWNDTEAAIQYRLEQARQLIRLSRYVIQLKSDRAEKPTILGSKSVRQFVNLIQGGGYQDRQSVLNDGASRKLFLGTALRELRSWCERYADMSELGPIRKLLITALKNFDGE
jgi:hypothetical protein